MSVFEDFKKRVDEFLLSILPKNPSSRPIYPKIIHDSVWGTNSFYSWEVALIDSPILQRLRRIHQTGLAFLVFPTATHTRFEHSLGVTILVDNLVNHLNNNKNCEFISNYERIDLRLAALLHDVGHSFFSHLSEAVYARMPVYQDLLSEIRSKYNGASPKGHEIFSLLIIKSQVFQKYFTEIISKCLKLSCNDKELEYLERIDWDKIAGWIIGYSENNKKRYLAEIINGPFDCDKLDYLTRDAKFAGPVIVYDIDRFYYSLDTIKLDGSEYLTVTLSGITALEQILISRMMLFSYIYHHHKVRSSEAMIKRLCFDIINHKLPESKEKINIVLDHPIDFLKYTDEVMLNSYSDVYNIPPQCKSIIKDLVNRNLWIRGILIGDFNLENGKCHSEYLRIEVDLHCPENIQELKSLKEEIISKAKYIDAECPIDSSDIWIDVPSPPTTNEVSRVIIKKSKASNESVQLTKVFPISAWVDAYKAQKWKSHIFCKKEYQGIVYEASKMVMKDSYNMVIMPFTKSFCKIPE